MVIKFVEDTSGNSPKAPIKASNERAPSGTFDRTAYQREYMRKKRAADKKAKDKIS